MYVCRCARARARMCRYVIHTSLYNMQAADPRIEKSVPVLYYVVASAVNVLSISILLYALVKCEHLSRA